MKSDEQVLTEIVEDRILFDPELEKLDWDVQPMTRVHYEAGAWGMYEWKSFLYFMGNNYENGPVKRILQAPMDVACKYMVVGVKQENDGLWLQTSKVVNWHRAQELGLVGRGGDILLNYWKECIRCETLTELGEKHGVRRYHALGGYPPPRKRPTIIKRIGKSIGFK